MKNNQILEFDNEHIATMLGRPTQTSQNALQFLK